MMMQTDAMRSAKYVALLRERFGPDAADRVAPPEMPNGAGPLPWSDDEGRFAAAVEAVRSAA